MTATLERELQSLIIDALGLEDLAPGDIDPQAPLFGEGLGLDSVDALELGLALQKRYGISIDPETRNMREHFASIANLAAFVAASQAASGENAAAQAAPGLPAEPSAQPPSHPSA